MLCIVAMAAEIPFSGPRNKTSDLIERSASAFFEGVSGEGMRGEAPWQGSSSRCHGAISAACRWLSAGAALADIPVTALSRLRYRIGSGAITATAYHRTRLRHRLGHAADVDSSAASIDAAATSSSVKQLITISHFSLESAMNF